MATERNIPDIIVKAFSVLMKSGIVNKLFPECIILIADAAIEAPSNSKTIETVVDVGNPSVLKRSSRITSVMTTERKMIITSEKTNMLGLKIPFRATSIMPIENVAPIRIPMLATVKISHFEAAFDPIAEFRKLTASLLTPTTKSEMARANKTITRIR